MGIDARSTDDRFHGLGDISISASMTFVTPNTGPAGNAPAAAVTMKVAPSMVTA